MKKVLFAASLISILLFGPVLPVHAKNGAVAHQNVSFVSRGVTLRGTVYTPSKAPIFAAGVWVDGSGETRIWRPSLW